MSNLSTQTSSVESPPSTAATSISSSMEGIGCTHLAEFVCRGLSARQEFVRGLEQARNRAQPSDREGIPSSNLQYHCIHCTASGDAAEAESHSTKTQHSFSLCSQATAIYCWHCKDHIYDRQLGQRSSNGTMSPTLRNKKRTAGEVDEDDAFVDNNSSKRPCGREGVRGLFNLGHTCYMNAVIQTLIHNSLLSSFFLGSGHSRHTCPRNDDSEDETPCVACGFAEIFSESRYSDQTQPMAAVSLLKASWLAIPAMQGEKQQDAHEWYLQIIDKLHDCVSPMENHKGTCRCFIHKAFFGRTQQEIACHKCGLVSRTQEHMLYLSLDFHKQLAASTPKKKGAAAAAAAAMTEPDTGNPPPTPSTPAHPTMISCLEDFIAEEKLPDDSLSCRGCSLPGKMTKSVRIRKLPAILCMQVNRFHNEVKGGSVVQKKLKGRVQYPLEIDMRPFTTRAKRPMERKTSTKIKKDAGSDPPDDRDWTTNGGTNHGDTTPESESSNHADQYIYELESVIVHEGKAIEQGHYFAFCRGPHPDGLKPAVPLSSSSSTTSSSISSTSSSFPSSSKNNANNVNSPPTKWYMFNDAKVTVAAEPMVLEQEAYLLFYSLKRIQGRQRPRKREEKLDRQAMEEEEEEEEGKSAIKTETETKPER